MMIDVQAAVEDLEACKERADRLRTLYNATPRERALRIAHAAFQKAENDPSRSSFAVTLCYNPPRRAPAAGPCDRILRDGSRQQIASGHRTYDNPWVQPARVHLDLDRLHRSVDRVLWGCRYNQNPPERRSSFRGMVEAAGTNLHIHLTWTVPLDRADEFLETITTAWRRYIRSGSIQVDPIRDNGWSWYATKSGARSANDPDRLVFSRALAVK